MGQRLMQDNTWVLSSHNSDPTDFGGTPYSNHKVLASEDKLLIFTRDVKQIEYDAYTIEVYQQNKVTGAWDSLYSYRSSNLISHYKSPIFNNGFKNTLLFQDGLLYFVSLHPKGNSVLDYYWLNVYTIGDSGIASIHEIPFHSILIEDSNSLPDTRLNFRYSLPLSKRKEQNEVSVLCENVNHRILYNFDLARRNFNETTFMNKSDYQVHAAQINKDYLYVLAKHAKTPFQHSYLYKYNLYNNGGLSLVDSIPVKKKFPLSYLRDLFVIDDSILFVSCSGCPKSPLPLQGDLWNKGMSFVFEKKDKEFTLIQVLRDSNFTFNYGMVNRLQFPYLLISEAASYRKLTRPYLYKFTEHDHKFHLVQRLPFQDDTTQFEYHYIFSIALNEKGQVFTHTRKADETPDWPTLPERDLTTNYIYIHEGCLELAEQPSHLKPDLRLPEDTLLCGLPAFLTPTESHQTYVWNEQDTGRTVRLSSSGIQTLTVRNDDGCRNRDTVNVTVKPLPATVFDTAYTICPEMDRNFYFQLPQDTNRTHWTASPPVAPDQNIIEGGNYTFRYYNGEECYTADTLVLRKVCPTVIHMPSAIRPNDDGLNDCLFPEGMGITQFTISVYSRDGAQIFQGEPNEQWCPKASVPSGVYLWTLYVQNDRNGTSNERVFKKGTVTILR